MSQCAAKVIGANHHVAQPVHVGALLGELGHAGQSDSWVGHRVSFLWIKVGIRTSTLSGITMTTPIEDNRRRVRGG